MQNAALRTALRASRYTRTNDLRMRTGVPKLADYQIELGRNTLEKIRHITTVQKLIQEDKQNKKTMNKHLAPSDILLPNTRI